MTKLACALLVLVALLAAFAAGSWHQARKAAAAPPPASRPVLYYVDPMNPAHTSDKPGLAPCGMKLEPVYADPVTGAGSAPGSPLLPAGSLSLTPEKQQLIGVRLGAVETRPLSDHLRLLGKVAVDETRVYRINATVDGWITKTMPVSTGSRVAKNETLATFYSPEFLSAGQALLFALNSQDRVQSTGQTSPVQQSQLAQFNLNLRQYMDSLKNLGMGELQIQEMVRTRQYMENIEIVSPAAGFITLRNVSEGQRFEKGTELFRLVDLSQVWILVDLYERDAALVAPQEPVAIRLPAQSKALTAKVSQTLPQFDNVTRTLKLRLEADNRDCALKPDMFVDVELAVRLPETLVVPTEAVLDTGLRTTVFVHRGNGRFEPRPVRTGLRLGDMVQITEGLQAGEQIVVSGNFLLDSESRMKLAAAATPPQQARDPVCGMMVEEAKAKAAGRLSTNAGKTFFFCNEGCKKEFDAHPAQYLPDAPSLSARATDPVCGMAVNEGKTRAAGRVTSYGGQSYYFCNESCKEAFTTDPEKYLKPGAVPPARAMPLHGPAAASTNPAAHRD